MSHTIELPQQQLQFEAEPGETVIQAARRNGITLPHSCLGGSCGACVAQLLQGSVSYPNGQPLTLNLADIEQGKAALCQAVAEDNLVIATPSARTTSDKPEVKMMPCRIQALEKPTDDVAIMTLALPPQSVFDYLPGQYIEFLLKDGSRRAFSIANTATTRDDQIVLHIRKVPNGYFTGAVFSSLKPGALLRMEGPFGDFYWRKAPSAPVVCVAGGTGIAPILSLLDHLPDNAKDRQIDLFWGVKRQSDLYCLAQIDDLKSRLSNLHFHPVLSEADAGWQGASGFVHQHALHSIGDFSQHVVYSCGPPPMIAALKESFMANGLQADRLFFDAFEIGTGT